MHLEPHAHPLIRPARFEDVPELLRLVHRAIEQGCRGHYDADQREAVYLTYARTLFVESLGPYETYAAEHGGRITGIAQLDPTDERLRALFVDEDLQGHGLGRALVTHLERRARRHRCTRLHGAMSLNAVPFYRRVGFHTINGPERLMSAGILIPVVRMEKRL